MTETTREVARPSVKALVEDIVRHKFGGGSPFRGEKAFVIVASDGATPRALVTDELIEGRAVVYTVALTCVNENEANRFAYQYSHELAHFYMTPEEHPVLEICAVAISVFTLGECSRRWEREKWGSYGLKFAQYRDDIERRALANLGIFDKQYLQRSSLRRDSPLTRSTLVNDYHIAAAILLIDKLEKYDSWEALTDLHRFLCTAEGGEFFVDFDLWLDAPTTNPTQKDLKRDFANLFGDIFDINQTHNSKSFTLRQIFSRCCGC